MRSDPSLRVVLDELVTASRILAAQGVLDGFGHVSVRDPASPDRFFIPRVRAPQLVVRDDLVALDLAGEPAEPTDVRVPAERAIHAAIYRARPDVRAVCHHHAEAILPFCLAATPLVPMFHVGATMGPCVPRWDSQAGFGDTDLLVTTAAQGESLARTLGPHWTVLMRGHGATVAARSVRELCIRSVYGARNAALQLEALRLGNVTPLTPGEALAAAEVNLRAMIVDRAWDLWVAQVASG